MNVLYDLELTDDEIINMVQQCPIISELTEEEIMMKVEILRQIGCNNRHIRNILSSNPYYLDRLDTDIIKLIKTLIKYKFDCIYLLLDSNPYILNKDSFEIENYINERLKQQDTLEDIIDDLDSNPYLFEEM